MLCFEYMHMYTFHGYIIKLGVGKQKWINLGMDASGECIRKILQIFQGCLVNSKMFVEVRSHSYEMVWLDRHLETG